MRKALFIYKVLFLIFFNSKGLSAQKLNLPNLSDEAEFSLITCSPGNELYNLFGHSAIRLRDPELRLDFVYNFGTFDFSTPNFALKFIQRKLMYSLSKSQYAPFLRVYVYEKRSVSEQKLLINSEQKQKLFEFLEENYLPQNREYLYDFFYDNCATRIRDAFEKGIGDVKIPEKASDKTFRDFLDEYLKHDPWLNFGIDLILGLEADKSCSYNNQMFLPDYLSSNLADATLNGKKLLGENVWLLEKSSENALVSGFSPFLLTSLLLLIEILLAFVVKNTLFHKIWSYLIFVIGGLAALFLLFMWLGTDHIATQKNLNLLWASPFYLLWIFVGIRKKISKFAKYLLYFMLLTNGIALLLFLFPTNYFNIAVLPLTLMFSINLIKSFLKSNS